MEAGEMEGPSSRLPLGPEALGLSGDKYIGDGMTRMEIHMARQLDPGGDTADAEMLGGDTWRRQSGPEGDTAETDGDARCGDAWRRRKEKHL